MLFNLLLAVAKGLITSRGTWTRGTTEAERGTASVSSLPRFHYGELHERDRVGPRCGAFFFLRYFSAAGGVDPRLN